MAESLRIIPLEEACRLFGSWPQRPLPATLHPAYVEADAVRTPGLEPLFLRYERGGERWLHSVHSMRIPGTRWRDASSPYGYGGPVATTDDLGFLADAWAAAAAWMREAGVVVEFLRFHPLLGNERGYPGQVQDNREVVHLDLEAPDPLAAAAVRVRQAVRKAAGAGVAYAEAPFIDHADVFGAFHRAALRTMGADPFYLFDDAYFAALGGMREARLGVCTGTASREWLAAALFLDGPGVREYHLAASSEPGRKLGAASLLLSQAALQARAGGAATLYLGGGTDARPDNALLFFKQGFSPLRAIYRTGSTVFLPDAYVQLEQRFAGERRAHPHWPIFHRKV